MATIREGFFDRREEVRRNADVPFFVFDAADEDAVKAACDATPETGGLPTVIGNCNRESYSIEERINATTWKVVARYVAPTFTQYTDPQARYAFDTGGGTQHVTQSISTSGRYGPKASALLQGAIGFDGKNVQGVDIVVPVFNWTELHWKRPSQVTDPYIQALFLATGKTNSDIWRGYQPGELLFLGVAGNRTWNGKTGGWYVNDDYQWDHI